jgi:peroxiredoxin
LNSTVLGISVDSLYTLAKFKQEQQINFTLLSDFNRDASIAYDCLYEQFNYGMKKVSKRSAFIIDREGLVKYAEVLENASDVPDFSTISKKLQEILSNLR